MAKQNYRRLIILLSILISLSTTLVFNILILGIPGHNTVESANACVTAGGVCCGGYTTAATSCNNCPAPNHGFIPFPPTNRCSTTTYCCKAPPTANFTLSMTPTSETIVAGNSATYTVTITYKNGFTGTVNLSTLGTLPSGASFSAFSPTDLTPSVTSSTIKVTTTNTTPAGTYSIGAQGASGTSSASAAATLIITAAPSFSISVLPPTNNVQQGNSATYGTVLVIPQRGFKGNVALTVTGLPAGASVTFNHPDSTVEDTSTADEHTGNYNSLRMVIATTNPTTLVGTYTLTVTGTPVSGVTKTKTFTLNVTAASTASNFSLSITNPSGNAPTLSMSAGSTGSHDISVNRVGTFTGIVNLSVTGLPAGASATFNPSSANIGSTPPAMSKVTSTLTIATKNNTPVGNYTLTIKGTSETINNTITVQLEVIDMQLPPPLPPVMPPPMP